MIQKLLLAAIALSQINTFAADNRAAEYRALTSKILRSGQFKIFLPSGEIPFSYSLSAATPLTAEPKVVSFPSSTRPGKTSYTFIDRYSLASNSYLESAAGKTTLNCIYVRGQDNRQNSNEFVPDLHFDVYLVAGDTECKSPSAGNIFDEESWETYLFYRVFKFDTFAPEYVSYKYHRNKFNAEFVSP